MTAKPSDKVETKPREFETKLIWSNPDDGHYPEFNERILVVLGSWRYRGGGFEPHVVIETVRVMQEDNEGSEDEGEEMAADLNSGKGKWSDYQFRLLDDDDQELSTYSDSIMWWTGMPMIPDRK